MMAWVWLVLASLLSCAGQLCQKQVTRSGGGQQVALWLGLALLALGGGMLAWLVVLQYLPVGVAYPMLSLNVVWVTLAAKTLWHESVPSRHWLGVGLIIVGVIVLGGSL
ncbi:4-amino-4-deoxy-L-arabinose-phospho-UDP flippase [Citrobacter freundii complex sp. CFNIH2]|uniref:4-amino-4-deoxy-L-arabinose-phosphoundecaprenol flippase subunit ArnE n=1 Tax=Citrobacter freundii complex sp. CFNIH2 TaxID=2066049 RepID=UPI000C868DF5|nr:4-amino-4-deoxy-L-arabinose-phosphoundecaprenol flippase subunit ArnE [Citrobacter freundii complex sp. CFNIH2]AUO67226.1 4-amino-4-deoxy-L-arabinose-phospho-UDP flippase [Citrobacter freundii complex sp. CFNIH2]